VVLSPTIGEAFAPSDLIEIHIMQNNLTPIPELYVSYDSAQKMKLEAAELASWDLTPRQVCDLELLMNGGFNPLKGFLGRADYDSVVAHMRLSDGALWPMPITLDVGAEFANTVELGQDIALRDPEGVILATMTVTDSWTPDKAAKPNRFLAPTTWLILP
jgi:sulfate adenylyltransferase